MLTPETALEIAMGSGSITLLASGGGGPSSSGVYPSGGVRVLRKRSREQIYGLGPFRFLEGSNYQHTNERCRRARGEFRPGIEFGREAERESS